MENNDINLEILRAREQFEKSHNKQINIYKQIENKIIVYNFILKRINPLMIFIEREFYSEDFETKLSTQILDCDTYNRKELILFIHNKFLFGYKVLDKNKEKKYNVI